MKRVRIAPEDPPQSYRQTAQAQREAARRVAAALEAGEPIARADAVLAAAVLQHWAENLPDHAPAQKRGNKPKFDVAAVALDYALLTRIHCMSHTAACKAIAQALPLVESWQAIAEAKKRHPEVFEAAAENFPDLSRKL